MDFDGVYAGVFYKVIEKNGKRYISPDQTGIALIAAGANAKLLNDIGDKDPDEVMRGFVESTPLQQD